MSLLILGLILFLGPHLLRVFADGWRSAQIARLGANSFKAIYSVISVIGFVLIIYGYGLARADPVLLYSPPAWTRHLASLLLIPAFILLAAAYVPRTRIKAAIGHPMVAGTKLWAFGHLIANGTLADVLLFGSFLAWAVLVFIAARKRDRAAGTVYKAGPMSRDAAAVVVGLALWAAFGLWLHGPLIGVRPFG